MAESRPGDSVRIVLCGRRCGVVAFAGIVLAVVYSLLVILKNVITYTHGIQTTAIVRQAERHLGRRPVNVVFEYEIAGQAVMGGDQLLSWPRVAAGDEIAGALYLSIGPLRHAVVLERRNWVGKMVVPSVVVVVGTLAVLVVNGRRGKQTGNADGSAGPGV